MSQIVIDVAFTYCSLQGSMKPLCRCIIQHTTVLFFFFFFFSINKFIIGRQSVERIVLAWLESLTTLPSCFSFWTWVEWFRSIFQFRRYANTLDTDSVPMEPLFAVYVPKDTCLHDEVDLRFRCTRITWRKQLDDEEEKQSNIKIGSGRSNRPLYPNEKAFVVLPQGIAAPGSQRMHLR
mgnify:CR=1 FL=1